MVRTQSLSWRTRWVIGILGLLVIAIAPAAARAADKLTGIKAGFFGS